MRKDLDAGRPVLCISTQLIECGVDISFRSVIRLAAGLDSILQAAGRCNRHVKGFKIIYLHPDKDGYPDYEAFKAAVGEHTAAFFVANPEDTGVYNKNVLKFTELVHGLLCCQWQCGQ